MPYSFSWVHISDLHFGHGSVGYGHDQALVITRLAADARDLVASGRVPKPDGILITGDIANSGGAERASEYEEALDWVRKLAADLNVDPASIYVIPGNHDVDRYTRDDHTMARLLDSLRRGAPIDDALAHPQERQMLSDQLPDYRRFAAQIGGVNMGHDRLALHWTTDIHIGDGFWIRLGALNSALLCAGQDMGFLQIGLEQIRGAVLPEVGPGTITMLMSHHPLDWLRPEDAAQLAPWINQSDVLLTGHLHEQDTIISRRGGGGSDLLRIAAGAAHGDEDSPAQHAFNFGSVTIDDEGGATVRVWPRKWAGGGGGAFVPDSERIDDEQQGCAIHPLNKKPLEPHETSHRQSKFSDPLKAVAEEAKRRLGSRRTAFPTDYSIAELAEESLLVEPRLVPFSGVGSQPLSLLELSALLDAGDAAVIVGQPGAGKTVLSYLLVDVLLRSGRRIAVNISVGSLADLPQPLSIEAVVEQAASESRGGLASEELVVSRKQFAFIIDGLDEMVAAGLPVPAAMNVLEQLPTLGAVLLTCRTREFEDYLVSRIGLDAYRGIWVLDQWDFDRDFTTYVSRLKRIGLVDDESILKTVAKSESLLEIIKTPLWARMLTYVLERGGSQVLELASLYSNYLQALARPVEARLHRTKCDVENVYALWQLLSWHFFKRKMFDRAFLPSSVPVALLTELQGIDWACAQTIASGLLDYTQLGPDLMARYRHYSFFEFLVADYLSAALVGRATSGAARSWDLLETDLPREIRRHLVRLLRRSAPALVRDLLVRQFRRLHEDVVDEVPRRVVGNLLAYILPRIDLRSDELQVLLENESDLFLQTSLYWALANAGDAELTLRYFDLLESSSRMASLNRGYLLYYHGDLDRENPPPYLDDEGTTAWVHTRDRTMELMGAADYVSRKPPARRALDVYTSLDFLNSRNEKPTHKEARLLHRLIEGIHSEHSALGEKVQALFERVQTSGGLN